MSGVALDVAAPYVLKCDGRVASVYGGQGEGEGRRRGMAGDQTAFEAERSMSLE